MQGLSAGCGIPDPYIIKVICQSDNRYSQCSLILTDSNMKIKELTKSNFVKYGGFSVWIGRRFWESRQFYSAYIALFIAISNWITIQYKLLLENVPFMNYFFSNIWVFMITAAIVFTILSVLGGHYIHRKRQFRIEQAVATEENPYSV